MSILEALKGAQAELARLQSPVERVRRVVTYARIITIELLGTVMAIPYGYRALMLHRSLPAAGIGPQRQHNSVSILRDVRYGPCSRNVMDIYLPPNITITELPPLDQSGPAAAGAAAAGTPASAQRPSGAGPAAAEPAAPGTRSSSPGGQGAAAAASGADAAEGVRGGPEAGQAAAPLLRPAGAPVLLFCHGGVWAAGSKWHYSPMATRLAQAGVITAVMQYSLYPEVLMPHMVTEVSRALSWTLDHIPGMGGDAAKVSLVGHSAGAHMCAMALLHRCLHADMHQQGQAGQQGSTRGSGSGVGNGRRTALGSRSSAGSAGEGAFDDPRMPALYVGMAGVYDIAKHFEFEQGRDVHELSTMKRACGGEEGFPTQSPAVILASALAREQGLQPGHQSWEGMQANPPELLEEAGVAGGSQQEQQGNPSYYRSFALRGEAIAQRVGFERAAAGARVAAPASPSEQRRQLGSVAAAEGGLPLGPNGMSRTQQQGLPVESSQRQAAVAASASAASSPSLSGVARQYDSYLPPVPPGLSAEPAEQQSQQGQQAQQAERDHIMGLTVRSARRLPPCVLMSSCADTVVPWYESSEMYWLLHDCGVPAKHLIYNKAGHGDFVRGWRPRAVLGSTLVGSVDDLPDVAGDLVKLVAGKVDLNFSR